ncbi:MAG TPA: phosphocholine cytidylyltransferase family protein [Candidatus Handelsmanbacteria bacterium]|nr:phosphocholine cytidylyltransferase family protein [Candidatus Handelsmanbacteria bacterium]
MKAIIMAAGVGSRIQGVVHNKPKCLIETNGQSLISRIVEMLQHKGIHDITVITGYKSELIREEMGSNVRYFHNPFYRVTNSIASLWLAKDLLADDDLILMNADLYFEEGVLDIAIAQDETAVMLSDSTRIDDADFRFGVDGRCIRKTGNKLTNAETDCEYVGIVRISKNFINAFKNRLEKMVSSRDMNNWWEGVLYSFIEERMDIFHQDVEGIFWTEVDTPADYKRLTDRTSPLP